MQTLITQFYEAFAELDAEKMVDCYHQDIVFEDPAFGRLQGQRAMNMWRMLCQSQQGKDFKVTYNDVGARDNIGVASWEAHYTFSKTGRKVHNKIKATFEFEDGKIIKHTDEFDLHRWARQALGIQGLLIGWTGFFRKKLQAQTNRLLDKFESHA